MARLQGVRLRSAVETPRGRSGSAVRALLTIPPRPGSPGPATATGGAGAQTWGGPPTPNTGKVAEATADFNFTKGRG